MMAQGFTSALARIGGWIARLILVLFVFLTIHSWLDVLIFQAEEYERLIGGEAGCGKFKSYCSWHAFVLDSVPDFALSILAVVGLLRRSLPRRALILGLLAVTICFYLGWRAYSTYVEASLS
jgi:hypothetical protein